MDKNVVGDDGQLYAFGLDKRVPTELVKDKLKPFDEVTYLTSIAKFVSENYPDGSIDEMYVLHDFTNVGAFAKIDRFFFDILLKNGTTQLEIDTLPKSELLKRLYALGCPELYYFHKSAAKTAKFPHAETIFPNPLDNNQTYVKREVWTTYEYLRPEDHTPFLLAIPALETHQAIEESYPEEAAKSTDFHLDTINFRNMKNDARAKVLGNTRIFSLNYADHNQFQKYVEERLKK